MAAMQESKAVTRALKLSQRLRLVIGVGAAIAVGTPLAFLTPWQLAMLAGWDAAALTIGGSIIVFVFALDGAATKAAAQREDLNQASDDLVIILGSLISLIGVVLSLIAANHNSGAVRALLIAIAIVTVVVSWLLVHTIFTLRYAHLYYNTPEGGVDFPDESAPDYQDFAYLAFTIGMTYQVSDTDVSQRSIRRTITRHSLVGYIFGTVIIGVTINVVGGLIK